MRQKIGRLYGFDQQHNDMTQTEREDIRAHLSMIQAIITRMSSASSHAKSWLLPVVTATYGYAVTKNSWKIGMLGIVAVALFAFIDANYLRQERAYRRLYDLIISNKGKVPLFSLNPPDTGNEKPSSARRMQRAWNFLGRCLSKWLPPFRVWLSWSIAPFYGTFLFVGIAIVWSTSR